MSEIIKIARKQMNILLLFPGFIIAFIIALYYERKIRLLRTAFRTESRKALTNKVHFYVARDIDGDLWLYLGKPERQRYSFMNSYEACGTLMVNERHFKHFGLNPDDFQNLKWEDKPVEVFLNLED